MRVLPRTPAKPYQVRVEPSGGYEVIAIDSSARTPAPKSSAFSRFLSNIVKLEQQRGLVSKMIDTMRGELMELLPDFGENLGYDGKAIESHSTGWEKCHGDAQCETNGYGRVVRVPLERARRIFQRHGAVQRGNENTDAEAL